MGKGCAVYKDIGKACKDLLSKDYGVGDTVVELKSKTASGLEFTPKATKKEDSSVAGELKTTYSLLPWLACEGTVGTKGSVKANLTAKDLMAGLEVKAECERAPPGKGVLSVGNLILDYKQALFTGKCSYDFIKKDLLASCSTVYAGAFTLGADCAVSPAGALTSWATACQYDGKEFIVSANIAEKKGAKTYSCGYYHVVSKQMQVGVALAKTPKPEPDIEFGCAYKLEDGASVKGKVKSDGKLSTSYKTKVSKIATMTLAAQIDSHNLSGTGHKFGMELALAP